MIRRRTDEQAFGREGVSARASVSLGVAADPEDGKTCSAHYRAKCAGGNTVCQ